MIEKINIHSKSQVKDFIKDSEICINLVGILFEKGSSTFKKVHTDFVDNLTSAIKEEKNVKHFIHFSSLKPSANIELRDLKAYRIIVLIPKYPQF